MLDLIGLGAEFTFRNNGSSAIRSVMDDIDALYTSIKSGSAVVDDLGERFEGFNKALIDGGLQTFAKGLAMTVGTTASILKAANFEEQFTGIKKYMTDDSLEGQISFNNELAKTAKYLGETKESVMDAAQSYMAMGLAQEQALAMAKKVKYAGKIWDVDGETSASSFQSISAIYKLDFVNDEEVANQFIDLVNTVADYTAAQGADILSFLSSAGSGLQLMGRVGMNEAMAMASAAKKAQVDIGHFGYAMRSISKNYVEKGSSAFEKLGISVKDANGDLKPMNETFGELQAIMNDIPYDKMTDWAMTMGGMYSDDLLRMLGGWSEYEKTMNIIAQGDYAGSAEREWSKITDTFNYNLNQTKVIFSDFIDSTFGALLPFLSKALGIFNKVFDGFVTFLNAHPKIKTFGAALFSLSGVALMVGGSLMMLVGFSNKFLMALQSGTLSFSKFTSGLTVMKTSILSLLPSIKMFTIQALKMSLSFGAIYLAWKYDIFGIKGLLENFQTMVKNSMAESKQLMTLTAEDMKVELSRLDASDSFGDGLTSAFTRIGIAWQALKDLWNDYTISDELYEKLVASGMEPVVTSIMLIVMRFRAFWAGFKEGFVKGAEIIRETIQNVIAPPIQWVGEKIIMPFIKLIGDVGVKLGIFSKDTISALSPTTNAWTEFGQNAGVLAAFGTALFAFAKIVSLVGFMMKPFVTIFSFIGKLAGGIGGVFGAIGKAIMGSDIMFAIQSVIGGAATIGEAFALAFPTITSVITGIGNGFMAVVGWVGTALGAIGGFVTAVLGALGFVVTLPAWVVGAITAAVVAIGALTVIYWDEICEFFSNLGQWISDFFSNLWNSDFMVGLREQFSNAIESVKEFFAPLGDFIKNSIDNLIEFFAPVGEMFSSMWESIVESAKSIWDNFTGWLSTIWEVTVGKGQKIWEKLTETWDIVVETASEFWQNIVDGFESMRTAVGNAISPIIEKFVEVKDTIVEFGQFIYEKSQEILETIKPYWDGMKDFISNIWDGIRDYIMETISNIRDFLMPIIDGICSFISGAWDTILEVTTNIWNNVVSVVMGTLTIAWNFISSILGAIFTTILDIFTSIYTTISNILTNVWDTIVGVWNGIFQAIGGVLNLIFGTISNVFMGILNFIMGNNEEAKQNFSDAWNSILNGIKDILVGIGSAVWSALKGVVKTIVDIGAGIIDVFTAPFKNALDWLFNSFIPDCFNVGSKIMNTIADGIRGAIGAVKDAVTGVFGWINDKLFPHSDAKEGPFSTLTYTGTRIPMTIGEGVTKAGDQLFNDIYDMSTGAMNELNPLLSDKDMNFNVNSRTNESIARSVNDDTSTSLASRFVVDDRQLNEARSILDSDVNLNQYQDVEKVFNYEGENYLTDAINALAEAIRNIKDRIFGKDESDDGEKFEINISSGAIVLQFNGNNTNKEEIMEAADALDDVLENKLRDIIRRIKDDGYF